MGREWTGTMSRVLIMSAGIRNLFMETVLKVCGARNTDELPETVRTAMKLKDYDNAGHP